MTSNIKVLQVIPKLGYGGAETGCYDIAHYLPENNCESFIVTSGGELLKFFYFSTKIVSTMKCCNKFSFCQLCLQHTRQWRCTTSSVNNGDVKK